MNPFNEGQARYKKQSHGDRHPDSTESCTWICMYLYTLLPLNNKPEAPRRRKSRRSEGLHESGCPRQASAEVTSERKPKWQEGARQVKSLRDRRTRFRASVPEGPASGKAPRRKWAWPSRPASLAGAEWGRGTVLKLSRARSRRALQIKVGSLSFIPTRSHQRVCSSRWMWLDL